MANSNIDIQLQEAQDVVKQVIGAEIERLSSMSPHGLYQPMEYILDLGGKRLRPMLAYLSFKTLKPAGRVEEIAPLMCAVEVFHNFSLLHDDLMDDAPVRRGKPTVYKKWGANAAILSGDGMLIEAYKALEQLPADLLPRILPIFNKMSIGVCEGQQYDMEFESRAFGDVTIDDYLSMIRLKTAYLFRGSMSMGAILAGANDEDVAHMTVAADKMGLAFQIMDDYLDLFAEPEFGKRRGGDIIEGKQTWLFISALAKDSGALRRAMETREEQARIDAVQSVYESCGIHHAALAEVKRLTEEAVDELAKLSKSSEALQVLFRSLTARAV